jgi:hypothetical protein
MRDTNLVNALRCVSTAGGPMSDCKKCPFYKTEPVPEDLVRKVNLTEWSSCDVDALGLAAADRIANQSTHIAAFQKEIEKLRGQNEQLREAVALVTNADRIRAATNQQLAKMLYDNQKEFCRIIYKNLGFEDELNFSEDYSDILAWLNAPSKEAEKALEAMKDE